MYSTDFYNCCGAQIIYDLHDATATAVKAQLARLKSYKIVVAISADSQGVDAAMRKGGFRSVGRGYRKAPRIGYLTLWARFSPKPKKAKKKVARRR